MTSAVYCLSSDEHKANAILTALRAAGFSSEISVVMENEVRSRNISLKEDATRGARIGSVAGALLALTIPGIGTALAVGPLLAALGGAAAGGVVGGLAGGSGAFGGLDLPEEVSRRFHDGVSKGDILISVHSEDLAALENAVRICHEARAEYVYDNRPLAA